MSIKFGDKTFRTPEEQIKKNMENIESINKVDTDFEKRIVKLEEEGGTIAKEYIDSKVSTLENEISTNKINISTNEQNITTNTLNIEINSKNISTNAHTIETLTSKLSTIENVADNANTTAAEAKTTADNANTTINNTILPLIETKQDKLLESTTIEINDNNYIFVKTIDTIDTTLLAGAIPNDYAVAKFVQSYIQTFFYNFIKLKNNNDIYIITFISAIAPNIYVNKGFEFLLRLCANDAIILCYCQKLNSNQNYYCFEKSTNENEIKLTSSYDLSYLYLNKEDTEILSFTYSKL